MHYFVINNSARRLASRNKSKISRVYSWLVIKFCRLALGGQTVKNLRRFSYEFELDQSQRKSTGALTCRILRIRLQDNNRRGSRKKIWPFSNFASGKKFSGKVLTPLVFSTFENTISYVLETENRLELPGVYLNSQLEKVKYFASRSRR